MHTLHISVTNKVATYSARDGAIVCGNDDYQVQFALDSVWDGLKAKARFRWNGKHKDVPIVDGLATVPRITNAHEVKVGVYSEDGSLKTTTAARVPCDKSILCGDSAPTEGNEAHYASEAQKAADRAEAAADRAEAAGGSGGGTGGGVVIDPESVNQAQEAAQAAQESAEAAADSAQAAGQSAEEAETSKSQATEAKEAAEAAQRAAEGARDEATQKAEEIKDVALSIPDWAMNGTKPTYTADEISGLAAKIRAEIAAAGTEIPFEFVDAIPADADTSKLYVIDGEVWAWMKKTVAVTHNANDGSCHDNKYPAANSNISTAMNPKNGCLTTAPIPLDKTQSNHKINLSGLEKLFTNYYAPCYVYYHKADGSWIGYVNPGNPTQGLGAVLEGDTLPLPSTFDVSKRADYFGQATQIRILFGITANTSISASDYENFVINCEWLNTTEDVWGWYSTGQRLFDDTTTKQNTEDIADLQERMGDVEEALGNGTGGAATAPLFGKLGLIGDSLTNQDYQGWQELAVSMLGNPAWHKNAVTGSSVANYGDQRSVDYPPFVNRYLDTPEDCDCIVIMGGSNDAIYQYRENLGEVGVLDTNTYKGAYSTIIEGLLTRNPATRIMLMTPPRSYTQADKALKTNIGKYAEATKEIAQYYGLPCLDFYDTLGWNKVTAEWCSFNFAGGDTVHFSNDIGPRVGRMVANFIRNNY